MNDEGWATFLFLEPLRHCAFFTVSIQKETCKESDADDDEDDADDKLQP